MLNVLIIVLPVIVMLILGKCCNTFGLLSNEGATQIKKLMVNVMLPVAIFHAMATGTYTKAVAIMFIVIMIILFVSLGMGYILRPVVGKTYGKYLPFIITIYEGGMIAYPLYSNACGSENLSNIATLDVANCLFCFSVLIILIRMQEDGIAPTASNLIKGAITSPTFDAAILGVIVGCSGVMNTFLGTSAGQIYQAVENVVTAPLSPMILIVVGYDMAFSKELIGPCVKAVLSRVVVQLICLIPAYYIVNNLFPGNLMMKLAILIYMIAPPSYSVPAFVKGDDCKRFMATVNSIYCLATIVLYVGILTVFMRS